MFDAFEALEFGRCHRFAEINENPWVNDEDIEDLCDDCRRGTLIVVRQHRLLEHEVRYVYILKLDGGKYCVGQTNDLELRLGDHKDGGANSTKGKNPKLVWYESFIGDKAEVNETEDHLTKLASSNPRATRRSVPEWQRPLKLLILDE